MVSTFSPNIQLEEPARGDQVGTWDTPVNNNMTLIDLVVGGQTTISLNNSPVVLSAPQFQCKTITFNSTLTGSVAITFPSTFTKSYEIYNTCTGSSAFIVTLQTTVAGGAVVCPPPGVYCGVINTGTGIRFTSLERIGTYWDYAGSSVPAWVSGSNPNPYLNCDGGTFSAATYPQLAVILGSTTLPDRRGTAGYTLNQGTGRLTTALGGLDGDVRGSLKATQATLGTSNLPAYTPAGSGVAIAPNSQNFATATGTEVIGYQAGATNKIILTGAIAANSGSSVNFTGTAQGGVSNVLPVGSATVTGIMMIRAG